MAYKARSITNKASSACKANMALIQGVSDVGSSRRKADIGKEFESNFEPESKASLKGNSGSIPVPSKTDDDTKENNKEI